MRALRLHKWVRSIAGPSFPKHNLQNNVKTVKKNSAVTEKDVPELNN